MRGILRTVALALSWTMLAFATSPDKTWTPAQHLEEARQLLDRAASAASSRDRRELDRLRTDFAALVLVYSRVPRASNDDQQAMAITGTAGAKPGASGERPTPTTSEPTGSGPAVPPKTSGVTPPPATSDKRPSEWQLAYAAVDADLKALDVSRSPRAVRTQIGKFRRELQLFYSTSLGRTDR